jgi:hypothetical protein
MFSPLEICKPPTATKRKPCNREGNVVLLTVFLMIVMIGILAFAVDFGVLETARTEIQRTADAAAMAGGWALLNDNRLKGPEELAAVEQEARNTVAEYCRLNQVFKATPTITYLSIGTNSVTVRLQQNTIPLFFGKIFNWSNGRTSAEAVAEFRDGVTGFRPPQPGYNSSLMPFAVKLSDWLAVWNGTAGMDNFQVDPQTGAVSSGADGLHELLMYPDRISGLSGNTISGNFGTVDIGSTGNSTADLRRQVLEGPSAWDFSYYEGNELKLGPDGTLRLNGDTGVSSGMELAIEQTIGAGPRTIFLYESVSNPGNTAQFVIVGFAGVRVLDCRFDGVHKYIYVQPAVVSDGSAFANNGYYKYSVYQPVRLTK